MADIKKIAENALQQLKKAGADMGQIRVSESVVNEMNLESGRFTLYRTLFNEGLSITAFKDQKKGSYSGNKTDDEAVATAVEMAMASAAAGNADEAYGIAPYQGEFREEEGPEQADEEKLFAHLQELIKDTEEKYPKLNLFCIIANFIQSRTYYMDTNGTRAEKRCGMYNFDIEFSAMDGEKTTSLDYTSFSTVDLDTPLLETAGLSLKFENTLKQLDVKPMEGKFVGTLVLDPGMTRWLFVDNLTNMISGSSALEKTSIYLDKVNQKIADERLSIVYDEEDERVLGTSILTGDGFKTEKFTLLDKGVLKSFVGDLMVENKTGFKHALNNLEGLKVLPGEKSIRDIIKGIDKGLYCGGFSGGQPGINGEFSG
ncbi:MAG: hypothetical protein HUJ69_09910, partial [Lachnospiraceae bacterium]|nr:hypothetical protein [Lachnospiraceae bacterium]